MHPVHEGLRTRELATCRWRRADSKAKADSAFTPVVTDQVMQSPWAVLSNHLPQPAQPVRCRFLTMIGASSFLPSPAMLRVPEWARSIKSE